MGRPLEHPLTRAWTLAADALPKGAAARALDALSPAVRALLVDGAGGQADAAQLLTHYAAEAWVSERLVRREGGAAFARYVSSRTDPLSLLLGALPKATRRSAERRLDAALPTPCPDPESLFPRSFSTRAQKRRGGVYTNRDLVDLVLDRVGWRGQGPLLEPAAGAGAFLIRAWTRALDAGASADALANAVVGNDVHPFAARAARTGLALEGAARGLTPSQLPRVRRADALAGPRGAPTQARGRYAAVVGNPPWVRGERIPPELRARYRATAPDLGSGNVDLASYFVRRAFTWLAPGGTLGFVVTQGLLEARSASGLRALLATKTLEAVVTLEWAPPQFAEATVIPCVLVVSNRPPPPKHELALGAAGLGSDGPLKIRWTRLRQDSWLALSPDPARPWPLLLARGDLGPLKRLAQAPTPLRAGYGLAVRTQVGARALVANGPPPKTFRSPRPLLDGREVRAWGIDSGGRTIDYRPELISDAKSPEFFRNPKVLVPRIALTPQAAVDEGPNPYYARNTVMIVRAPGTPLDDAPHATAALVNSLPVRSYAFHLLRAGVLAGSHRATFYSGMINGLPVPQPVLDDARLLQRLDRLGRKAATLAAARDTKALTRLEAQIDAAVATAFGLTPAQLTTLRTRASRAPLSTVLHPARLGSTTRRLNVATYTPGARYR